MQLVNETGQPVQYWIQSASNAECGSIDIDGIANHPEFDNQMNVYVGFNTASGDFSINCEDTGTGEQVEMALVVEAGG